MQRCREKCPPDQFELIEQYCNKFSPDWLVELELDELATVLKNIIWNDKLNDLELDAIVESYLHQPTPNKDGVSHCMFSIPRLVLDLPLRNFTES
jgi:hypothetical protein